ncbi:DegT/DnrJ/EryC1/StrS family aminotransferase [Holospora curviuscula]|uniref:UDP-2-acetamido-2-deoxy-3-oxo-D-glucuronate aminotransferase n=1 Tax=Holospora curviuscula TaxID=1082868 RepID=A0A2S5R751_9PROT|nr:DegT/DnrJ/EryC1/StrS aminotransferase family protein [Holospora curviuscula]PPE03134.1 UDP-2-acetamido-2-deoxy-3-oxo-D-glucuronate aminotransferase [Holospora curviuscula]
MTTQLKQPEMIQHMQFIDLKSQLELIRPQIDAAIKRVLDHGNFIMGPEVHALEKQLAEFCGVKHAISCANGTDALGLGLMAKNVGPGDAIFVPSFTFAATAEVVSWVGGTPVFIDSLEDTYNMDPKSLEQGIKQAQKLGLKHAGIIPVDLFGQPADYDAIQAIADEYNLWIMADGAQSFGASYKDRKVGNIGNIATTSFFPAKPLGCYGDGGAIFTNDDELSAIIKSLRVHGQGSDKYDNVRIGMNGRLDTIQAAILIEKLKIFPNELIARQKAADAYNAALKDIVKVPHVIDGATSAWAQYTLLLPEHMDRSKLIASLKEAGVPTMIYYVKPLHLQTAYKHYPTATGGSLPVCEGLSEQVLSLPMSGYVGGDSMHVSMLLRGIIC